MVINYRRRIMENPDLHHVDCDYRNSKYAHDFAELTGEGGDFIVFDCNLDCEQAAKTKFVLIDYKDDAFTEITNITGPFDTEEEADQWDENTGQRYGLHVIMPIYAP